MIIINEEIYSWKQNVKMDLREKTDINQKQLQVQVQSICVR